MSRRRAAGTGPSLAMAGAAARATAAATADAGRTHRPTDPPAILSGLEAGTIRAATPDPAAPGGWRADPAVRAAILGRFADRTSAESSAGPLRFRDRAGVPLHPLGDPAVRVVPGGTSVRSGVHLAPGVVIMPPSFINIGAWIGHDAMIDSHVVIGSCAQVGARVHLAAGVILGGVLEPPGAWPVIVEDDAFVGAGSCLLEGVLVGAGAVIAAGVTLTGTSRLYDLVGERVLGGTADTPLSVPPRAVVVPGVRRLQGSFAQGHGLGVAAALLVKYRDAGTDARVAQEDVLR